MVCEILMTNGFKFVQVIWLLFFLVVIDFFSLEYWPIIVHIGLKIIL